MTHTLERSAADAYDALAPFYDTFTAHHDYDLWADVLLRLARAHGLTGNRLLDIGCGTGKSFLPFAHMGWRITACDVSARMLRIAAEKAPAHVDLHLADARELPELGEFDLVLLLDDVVNYLTAPDDLVRAFAAAAGNLAPDGVLLFDANTLLTYRTFFSESVVVEAGDHYLVWRGRTPSDAEPSVLADAVLDAFARGADGAWERHASVHRQRHHTEATVRAALADAGLDCVAVFGQGYDARPVAGADQLGHTKALYIARHNAQGDERR
jgi:predicted TPR repeat methyltransferase